MTRRRLHAVAPWLMFCAACASPAKDPPISDLRAVESPAGLASEEPNLAVDAAGRVHLSWLQRTSDTTFALRYAVRDGDAWSTPVTIVERADLFVNWADFPSLHVSPSGRVVAHWLQRSGTSRYAYDAIFSQSSDGGATWSTPTALNTDGLPAEHGFVSLFPADGDSVEAVWLDGRATGGHEGGPGAMQLANRRIAADGGASPNVILDQRICDCCQTSAAMSSHGPVVVFRDRSPDEIRDIAVVRRVNGRWTEPALVHADDWTVDGCPVNGPAIAAEGDRVVVAWFTAARDTARVNAAFSDDAGATFGPAIRVDEGQPVGRVDVVLDDRGRAIVSWLERGAEEEARVLVRAVARDGAVSAPIAIAASSAARRSGFPRMVRAGPDLVMAWTVAGDTSRVDLARARLTGSR